MSVRLYSVLIDCADPHSLGHWWAQVLDWQVTLDDEDEVDVAAGRDADGKELEPILTFLPVAEAKSGKNRLHIDLVPDDQYAEVERLIGLGAKRVNIGQGSEGPVSWVVLADPEGNEFCVLAAR